MRLLLTQYQIDKNVCTILKPIHTLFRNDLYEKLVRYHMSASYCNKFDKAQ